jgi:hypothetical protein
MFRERSIFHSKFTVKKILRVFRVLRSRWIDQLHRDGIALVFKEQGKVVRFDIATALVASFSSEVGRPDPGKLGLPSDLTGRDAVEAPGARTI